MTPNETESALAYTISTLADAGGVSDFLVKAGEPVWCRANGSLRRTKSAAVSEADILELLRANEAYTGIKVDGLSKQLNATGDLDFALRVGAHRFRANLYRVDGKALAIALRALSDRAPDLATLGLPASFHKLIEQSKGLILITGATGSGKTTTLASTLEHLNATTSSHIITLEDPIEYVIKSRKSLVDQRQVGRDVSSFPVGLRSALRQDPDVLLVGELRDLETVKTALDAANTGHLVLGTMHTNSALQSIERLTSFFSAEQRDWVHAVLSQALIGIVSQVLVPKREGGRLLAAEILVSTPDVRQVIREKNTNRLFNAMDTGSEKGHVLLNRFLREQVAKGVISAEAAAYSTYDPNGLSKELSRG